MPTNPNISELQYLQVSATKFAKSFGQYESKAARNPIVVTNHNRIAGYFISPEDFEHYQELRRNERKAYLISELPERIWQAIEAAEYPSGFDHLNELMSEETGSDGTT